jgi:hypothetical protein
MNELQLVSVGKVMTGGTTKPFTALALNEQGSVEEYVVKAFTEKQVSQYAPVSNEILCCELAKMFDLSVPDYGIMNFDRLDLERVYAKEWVDILDTGAKFCSKFMGQYTIFSPATSTAYLKDYEILNIFAFDVFVSNVDRGGYRNKPNLLINDNELMVIDHELTFPYTDDDFEKRLVLFNNKKHVLYKYISKLRIKDRVFDEFLLSLSTLNLNKLRETFNDFDKYGIAYKNKENFMNYFAWAKNNVAIFERYLIGMTK